MACLTTAEIANAFLVREGTMAQRISRAKQGIKASGVAFRLPSSQERYQRLRAVLHVLYLIFNEGYTGSAGPHLQRLELSREAIRLTRSVYAMLPDDGEVAGLLALMLLTDARIAGHSDDLIARIAVAELAPDGVLPRPERARQALGDDCGFPRALPGTASPEQFPWSLVHLLIVQGHQRI
jgi:predicted RNA polymerase sigma factor